MAHLVKNDSINLMDEFLNRDVLQSYLDFISNINFIKDEEAQKIISNFKYSLIQLAKIGFFTKQNFNEIEKYFVTTFSPLLIHKISKESILSKTIKDNLWKVVNIYLDQMVENLESLLLYDIWIALIDFFNEDTIFAKSSCYDVSDKFLDLKYDFFLPDSLYWKSTLTSEMKIDCLIKDFENNFNNDRLGVASWSRGLILCIDTKIITFKFLGTGQISSLPLNTFQIVPFNFLSKDFDWRESIKEGEEIDYLDSKSWYRSTVIRVFERNNENEYYKYIKIGLRVYRENGKCRDNKGRRYFGWSENFDKEVSVHDPRVRMPNCYSKTIENYDLISSYPNDNRKFNDLETYIPLKVNDKVNFIIPTKSNKLKGLDIEYFNSLNNFCENGGFNMLLSLFKRKSTINYDLFSLGLDLIYNNHEYFHYHFAKDFLKEYIKKSMKFLINFSKIESKYFKRDHLDKVLKKLKEMLYKVYIESDVNFTFDSFLIDFGLCCITSTSLEKKLIGIKYLSSSLLESIRTNLGQNMTSYMENRIHTRTLINNIKDKNIVEFIFGNSSHVQLIQRSNDLVKVLLMFNELSKENITKIYELTNSSDMDIKKSIFKILQSNYHYYSNDLASFLISKILEKSAETFSRMDLDLISDLYKSMNSTKQVEISNYITKSYKNMIFLSNLDTELTDYLINELVVYLKKSEIREQMISYLSDLIITYKENYQRISLLKVLKFFRLLIQSFNSLIDEIHKNTIIKLLFDEYSIVGLIIDNVSNHQKCSERMILSKEEDVGKLDFVLGCFDINYSSEIFDFLRVINTSNNSLFTFDESIIDSLYNVFVENPISKKEINLFFLWLKETDDKKLLPSNSYQKIFNRMVLLEKIEFCNIGIDLFNTIWNIFISVNKNLHKIDIEIFENRYSNRKKLSEKKEEVILKCEPFDLEGFNLIWKLTIVCPEGEVRKTSIDNFIKLFSYSNNNIDSLGKIWKDLVGRCFTTINSLYELSDSSEKELKIINISLIIKALIEESEIHGIFGIKSHLSILKKRILNINIQDHISSSSKSIYNPDYFQLTVYGNTTIWEIKEMVSRKLDIASDIIKLYFNDSTSSSVSNTERLEISPKCNGKTLLEMKIKNGDTFIIMNNDLSNQLDKPCLLNEIGDFIPKMKEVITETFKKYSTNNKMSKQECTRFLNIAYETIQPIKVNDYFLINIFEKFDDDHDNYIDLDGFFKFFKTLLDCTGKNNLIWNILKRLGYRNELKKINKSSCFNQIGKEDLPRYFISCNKRYFSQLISLEKENSLISKEAYYLLSLISTNFEIYNKIVTVEKQFIEMNSNLPIWEDLFNCTNSMQVLYSIDIIESFFEYLDIGDSEAEYIPSELYHNEDYIKNQSIEWIRMFIVKGGIKFILKITLDIHINNNFLLNHCLNKCIKILRECLELLFISKGLLSISNTKKDNYLAEELINKLKDDLNDSILKGNDIIHISQIINTLVSNLINDEVDNYLTYKIINQSLKLWNLLVVSSLFYCSEICDNLVSVIDLKKMIILGILENNSKRIKHIFYKNLKKLVLLLFSSNQYSFIYLILNLFFEKSYEIIDNSYYVDYTQFFRIFEFILSKALEDTEINISFDFTNHAVKLSEILLKPKLNQIKEETLKGILNIIDSIIIVYPHLKYKIGFEKRLISVIFEQLLIKDSNPNKLETLSNNESDMTLLDKETLSLIKENDLDGKEMTKAIYSTLNILISDEKTNLEILFSGILRDILNNKKLTKRLNYDPFSEKKIGINLVGLKNLGSTCYMNSMLQQFFNIPTFRYCLLQIKDKKHKKILDKTLDQNDDNNVLNQLHNMFSFLELSNRKFYTPKGFCFAFKDIDGNPTNIEVQQDAQEFLGRLFSVLEKQTDKTQFKYLLGSVFGGKSCSQLICEGGCGNIRNNIEDFYNISLEVRNHKTLKDTLDKYVSIEKIEDYKCEICKKEVTVSKRNSIVELPNVLIVHLQRILFDYDNLQNNKINSRLEFPLTLNMKPYTSEVLNNNEKYKDILSNSDNSSFTFYEKEDSYYEYFLVGVVVHTGSADAGHYYSYINVKRDGLINEMQSNPNVQEDVNCWFEFNDSNIYSFNPNKIEEECFGGYEENEINWVNCPSNEKDSKGKSAYILFYERKKKKPLKMLIEKEQVNNNVTLIELDKSNTYEMEKQYDIFNNEFNREIEQLAKINISEVLFKDKEKDELYYYEAFYNIQKKIPKEHFKQVYVDNMNFLNDQKIFNPNFNHFINKSIYTLKNLVLQKAIKEDTSKMILKLSTKFLIEVLPKSYYKQYLNDIVYNVNFLFSLLPDVTEDAIHIILENSADLTDVIFSPDESSNQAYKDLFLQTIIINFNINKKELKSKRAIYMGSKIKDNCLSQNDYFPVIKLLDKLVSWLPNEVSKNWIKMKGYLQLLEGLSDSGELLVEFLMSREIIYKLIDFFLAEDSPFCKHSEKRLEIGSKNSKTHFKPLIATIANICKYCYTDKWNSDKEKIGLNPPYYFIGKKLDLSIRDKECILLKSFYHKAIKENYDPESIGKILAHFMFNNLEFTKKRLYLIIELFNYNFDLIEVTSYFKIFSEILKVEDQYTKLRIEYIFGIPQMNLNYSGSIPQIIRQYDIYNYNIYWFYSPILYNTSYYSLNDQIIYHLSHSDILIILSYYFDMVLNNSSLFNYFDNCPSPISQNKTLKDYLIEFIEKEISTVKEFTKERDIGYHIKKLKSLRTQYLTVRNEFQIRGKLSNLYLQPNYSIENIINETIVLDKTNERLTSRYVHLQIIQYDVQIKLDICNHRETLNKQIEFNNEVREEIKVDDKKCDYELNYDVNNNNHQNIEEIAKDTNDNVGNLEEMKFYSESVNSIQKYNSMGEEEFYRKIVHNELYKNNVFSRNFFNHIQLSHLNIKNCLKRYLIVNNSDKDFKIKLKFSKIKDDDQTNEYIPDSEIVVTIKRFSASNALTIIKYNYNLDFSQLDIKVDISSYDFGHDDYYSYNNFEDFRSKNIDETRINSSKLETTDISNKVTSGIYDNHIHDDIQKDLEFNNKNYNETEMNISNDYFILECSHCKQANRFSNNCMTYICSFCQRDPFE